MCLITVNIVERKIRSSLRVIGGLESIFVGAVYSILFFIFLNLLLIGIFYVLTQFSCKSDLGIVILHILKLVIYICKSSHNFPEPGKPQIA